jgi:hypothetical protein
MARRYCACTLAAVLFNRMHGNERIPVSAEAEVADVRLMEPEQDTQIGAVSDTSAEADEIGGTLSPAGPARAQEEQHQNQAEKESAMIDVHAPHGGIHTWRDFWIHLGTIALGLLIALGLEQGVEWMHHLHQRHQLEQDLHAEAEKNLAIMDGDYRYCDVRMAYIAANRERVDAMRDGHGKVKVSYIAYQGGTTLASPLASVWTTAKESQLVALLPREQARFYDRVYRQYDIYMTAHENQAEAGVELFNFEAQFAAIPKKPWDPIYPDISRMSAGQLDQESALLTKMWLALDRMRARLDYFYKAESTVLHGGATDRDVLGSNLVHHPLTVLPAQPEGAVATPEAKGTEKP